MCLDWEVGGTAGSRNIILSFGYQCLIIPQESTSNTCKSESFILPDRSQMD